MDWSAIAMSLVRTSSSAILVLDSESRLQFLNPAAAELLGRDGREVVGESLDRLGLLPAHGGSVEDALREGRRRFSAVVRRPGWEVALTVEVRLPGPHPLLKISRAGDRGRVAERTSYLELEVLRAPGVRGVVDRVTVASAGRDGGAGRHCYELLHDLDAPCAHCPVWQEDAAPPGLPVVVSAGSHGALLVEIEASDPTHYRVVERALPDHALEHLVTWRVDAVSEGAGLTPRERDVVLQLAVGRTGVEAARRLGITQRTVKFHQSNALGKLGAETRADLIDMVFAEGRRDRHDGRSEHASATTRTVRAAGQHRGSNAHALASDRRRPRARPVSAPRRPPRADDRRAR